MQFPPQSTAKENVKGKGHIGIEKRERKKTDNVIKCAGSEYLSLNAQQDWEVRLHGFLSLDSRRK
jgi:hypothetical protein